MSGAETTGQVTIGQIGCGNWGRHILRDLKSLGCDVHVVARSPESIERAADGGAASIVETPEELPQVDGVVVASITTTHAEMIERVGSARPCPIYVEKPLCVDPDEADRLVAKYGDRLFVMDKWRYHAGVLELARIANSGELGELQSVQTRRVTFRNPHKDVDTIWTHLPHDLSIAIELLGEVPPARFAVAEQTDVGRIGMTATLGGPPWLNVEVSDAAPDHRRELRIVCSGGSAQLDGGWSEQVTVRRSGASEDEIRETPGELPLLAELRAFVDHLGGGPPPKSSAAEAALQVRRIVELGDMAEKNEDAQ